MSLYIIGRLCHKNEGPIVIDNLDQSDLEKISRGTTANDHNAQSSTSAPENFQPTCCPSGLSRTQRRKLQHAHCKKLKQEGLTKMGEQIFSKDPIVPQSSKKESAACSKSARLTSQLAQPTSPIQAALANPQLAKPASESAEPTFSGLGASGVSPVDSIPAVVDLVPTRVDKLSGGQAIF